METRSKKRLSLTGTKRPAFSPFTPSKNKRISKASSVRSSQLNQIIYKTPYHVVENFGTSLPVLVREALTFSDKNAAVSVRISPDGWVWFVCGRRLLVWQCKSSIEDGRRKPISSQCRELTLPSSDLAYKAEHVVIFMNPDSQLQVPSCIAASPEGVVRYWPSIAHEGSSVEVNADLQGQECDSLTDISPLGCVLATTTATIVHVQPLIQNGRHNVLCRTLKLPQGWLGGLSRKMSSLIFGQASHSLLETKLIKTCAVKCSGYNTDEWNLYVLAGHTIQKWIIVSKELERLTYELEINRLAVEAYQKTIWEPCGSNANELQVWLLDMQPTTNGIVILMGGVNNQISSQFYYAFGFLSTDSLNQPSKFDRFCPLKNTAFYRENEETELTSCKFLLIGTLAILYSQRKVLAASAINYGEEADYIDFVNPHDQILGASLCCNTPVFFTREHGLVSITPSDISPHDFTNNSVSDVVTIDPSSTSLTSDQLDLAVTDADLDEMCLNKDSVTQLKAAYLHYLKKNKETSERIINNLFQLDDEPPMEVDNPMDTVILKVAFDLINDVPAGDPRWVAAKIHQTTLGSTVSLQIINQLEDKERVLDLYFVFLKDLKIWYKLTAVTVRDTVLATTHALCEYGEKLVAAISLRNLQSSHNTLIEQCIKHVVGGKRPGHGLTQQDLFYREVSRLHECLQVLTKWSESIAHSDRCPQEIANALAEANTVLTSVLQDVLQYRKQKGDNYKTKERGIRKSTETLPWTAAPGEDGLRDSLLLQHELTLKYGVKIIGELDLKCKLLDQLLTLTDIILDGRRNHVDSLKGSSKYDLMKQQYETQRMNIIKLFLDQKEYERAAILAEKYYDFHSLVLICELTDNPQRLDSYCEKFEDKDFSSFLYNWYLREQKPGRLIEQFRNNVKPQKLKRDLNHFLSDHPTISWVQDIFSGGLKHASNTLHDLAKHETELVDRKRTILSMSKLTLLCSDENESNCEDKIHEINLDLNLITHQKEIPQEVLVAFGLDGEKQRVMSASEIIKCLISEEYTNASEIDFKFALDLIEYIDDDFERNEMKNLIWYSAILRDNWTDIDPNAPIDTVLNLLFFKIVDVLECSGADIDELLPPISNLLEAKELGDLKNDTRFNYLIRLGYKHFQKTPE